METYTDFGVYTDYTTIVELSSPFKEIVSLLFFLFFFFLNTPLQSSLSFNLEQNFFFMMYLKFLFDYPKTA